MTIKEFVTLAISLTALALSLVSFFRSRRIDRLGVKQSLIERKYAALAKDEEQQAQMYRLIVRLTALEAQSDDAASLKATLNETFQSALERSKRLAELNIDNPNGETDLILRERLGLLTYRDAILKAAETKVEWLEKLAAKRQ
jgi:hypothetical protein